MKCPKCGEDLKDATACDRCGQRADAPDVEQGRREGDEGEPLVLPGDAGQAQPNASPLLLGATGGGPEQVTPPDDPGMSSSCNTGDDDNKKSDDKEGQPSRQTGQEENQKGEPRRGKQEKVKGDKYSIKDSEIEQFAAVQGERNIIAKNYYHVAGERAREQKDEKTFCELTVELPVFSPEYPESVFEGLDERHATLKAKRILLVSSYHEHLALSAAHALVEQFGFADAGQKRLLNFERIPKEHRDFGIFKAIESREDDAAGEVVTLIDAAGGEARDFLVTLLYASATSPSVITDGLKRNDLFLVCVADSEEVDRRLKNRSRHLPFAHWRIDFLETLLKFYYPEQAESLREWINRQRAGGRWHRDEGEFCNEINGALKSGQLLAEISAREAVAAPAAGPHLFRGDDSVEDTVLYAATYFPNLRQSEFNRVVAALLGDRTTTVTVNSLEKADDGTTRQVAVQKEERLLQIWTKSADKIVRACKLAPAKGPARHITFSEYRTKGELKRLLEDEHGFFLENRFSDALDSGLLFDSSDKVAENVIRLLVEAMAANDGTYGNTWLMQLVRCVEAHFRAVGEQQPDGGPPDAAMQALAGKTKEQAYKRVADILRGMMDNAELADKVDSLLRELMSTRPLHGAALELIKGLRPTAEQKEFHWLRKLIDQSDEATINHAYLYLYGEVRKMNLGAYEVFARLESWLPAADRDRSTYAFSNTCALLLMIEYSLETTARFDANNYGERPVKHPLLAAEDEAAADRNFSILARWLFHPGVKFVFAERNPRENPHHLLGALIAEWAFIIIGPPSAAAKEKGGASTATAPAPPVLAEFGPPALLRSLLRQIVVSTSGRANRKTQEDLLNYWEAYSDMLLTLGDAFEFFDFKQRREFGWKRNLVRSLLIQFRELRQQLGATPHPTGG